jgi:putative DNA primase/helicase
MLDTDPIVEDGELRPELMVMSDEAKAEWILFHDQIEASLRCGGELHDVRDVASKAADNIARLAALFYYFCRESRKCRDALPKEYITMAGSLVAWHLHEARRFFGELALPLELVNAAKLDSWLVGYCKREGTHMVPTRTVQRLGPNGVRDRAALDAALRELEELARVSVRQEARQKLIHVNPRLLGAA